MVIVVKWRCAWGYFKVGADHISTGDAAGIVIVDEGDMAIFYVDGEYVEEAQAALPLTDIAILRGYAVFDFLRTYNGRPFHLGDHLRRLQNSAGLLHIACPWSVDELTDIVEELLRQNRFAETNVRFIITGGDSSDSITPEDKTRLVIMATPVKTYPAEWYSNGVKIITSEVTRYRPESKSTNYIQAIMALRRGRDEGAVEAVYVNEDNEVLEGTTSNFFVVDGETIITPERGILPGITRDVVIRLASEKFVVERASISRDILPSYSEMFLTSSNKEVAPVVRVDNFRVSDVPGPVTREVMRLFGEYTRAW
jgi:branched-chain amino acid aminotransferase